MPEIADYVNRGASAITPRVLNTVLRQLPLWKAEFSQISSPEHPHLVKQLDFLANAVEDFAEQACLDLPYSAMAAAVFALTYAHRKVDIIPDFMANLGRADDSSIVRAVLIQHERSFATYATKQGYNWDKITCKP